VGLSLFSKLTDPLFAGAARSRNRPFLEAAMASAALAAVADGPVSLAERHTLDQVLESIEALRAFEVHEAVSVFDKFIAGIRDDLASGRAAALRAVSVLADNAALSPVLVRIAMALARADGAVTTPVQEELAAIAAALGQQIPQEAEATLLDIGADGEPVITIVLGNEKGGTGKSTTAMHLVVALLKLGHNVASIDLDGRQGTLTRYVANRAAHAHRSGVDIPMSIHCAIAESDARDRDEGFVRDRDRLRHAFAEAAGCRFVVIDTPGSSSRLSHLAHTHADILITPLNDSFLDVDALARIDRERREVQGPSPYSEMVQAQSEQRVAAGRAPIDWVVMRNRLAHIDARNSREMSTLLDQLGERLRFRLVQGFGERVVFRELFYRGLTLFDLPDDGSLERAPASHVHARLEIDDLMGALGIGAMNIAAPGRESRTASARP
jgi:chromosome partitioning protein